MTVGSVTVAVADTLQVHKPIMEDSFGIHYRNSPLTST